MRTLDFQVLQEKWVSTVPVFNEYFYENLRADVLRLCILFRQVIVTAPPGTVFCMLDGTSWNNTMHCCEDMKVMKGFLNKMVTTLNSESTPVKLKVLVILTISPKVPSILVRYAGRSRLNRFAYFMIGLASDPDRPLLFPGTFFSCCWSTVKGKVEKSVISSSSDVLQPSNSVQTFALASSHATLILFCFSISHRGVNVIRNHLSHIETQLRKIFYISRNVMCNKHDLACFTRIRSKGRLGRIKAFL